MTKQRNKFLHGLLKFSSIAKVFQVGNAASVNNLLIVPIIITVHGHMFEINTMVSETDENGNLVLGFKNFVELEGELHMRELNLSF